MWDCDGSVGPQDRVRKICGRCEMPTRLLHEKDSSLQRRFFYGQVWIFFYLYFWYANQVANTNKVLPTKPIKIQRS